MLPEKASRHVIVIRSTVKPGTIEEVIQPALERASGLQSGRDFSLCFQPEFLREGKALLDRAPRGSDPSLGQFLEAGGYGTWFQRHFLLPMAGAIWSAPSSRWSSTSTGTCSRSTCKA